MMHFEIKLPLIEVFAGQSHSRKKNRGCFLYSTGPTHWRENWREISGFSVHAFGKYLTLCVWK
jgi:hypothetical protein